MDRLRNSKGVTIIEILIASFIAAVVFLAVASSFVSGLRLMNAATDLDSLDPAMAINIMSKNIALASQITISISGPVTGQQITLRMDYNNVNGTPTTPRYTSSTFDDYYIMYRFIGNRLRTTYLPMPPGPNVGGGDPEVVPGLVVTAGSFSLFNPVNNQSNSVNISIQSGGTTLNTVTASGEGPKEQ